MEKYDIIVVGSGLGGFVSANMLSKEGIVYPFAQGHKHFVERLID